MKCRNCPHELSQHSPDHDGPGAHSCDECDCPGFQEVKN